MSSHHILSLAVFCQKEVVCEVKVQVKHVSSAQVPSGWMRILTGRASGRLDWQAGRVQAVMQSIQAAA